MIFPRWFAATKKNLTVDQYVGGRIRHFRESKGVSIAVVAEKISLSSKQLAFAELGRRRLSASQLFAIARHLDVSVAAFFDRREGTL